MKDGRLLETEFENFDLRYYERQEFEDLLLEAGFVDVKVPKVYAAAEPHADEEIVFECSKP